MAKRTKTTCGKTVLLGVSGGIAAYKAVDLASKLVGAGFAVHTVMTANACELVGAKSFEAVTGNAVYSSLWSAPQEFRIGHISLAEAADVVVVAPATANIIAKAAGGICDDLLSTTLCVCWQKPVLFAPAMNTRMWNNPIVKKNVAILKKELKVQFIGPAEGRLACGETGPGRMAEPADILRRIQEILG
jgi:phosphopantothenoylcysteine decarboxylase/phosphopantothenate--cysteine ligase